MTVKQLMAVLLAVGAFASPALAQAASPTQSQSSLEGTLNQAGMLTLREELAISPPSNSQNVQAIEAVSILFPTLANSKAVGGIRIELGDRVKYSGVVDYDEIAGLVAALEYMKGQLTRPQAEGTEIRFRTRGDVSFVLFASQVSRNWRLAVTVRSETGFLGNDPAAAIDFFRGELLKGKAWLEKQGVK